MLVIKLLLLLAIMAAGAGFSIINQTPVTVDLYFVQYNVPLFLPLLIALGLGVLLVGVPGTIRSLGVRRQNSALKRKAKLANEEIENLRTALAKEG